MQKVKQCWIAEIIDRYHKTMEKFKYPRWLQYKSDNGQLRTFSHQSVLYQREKSLKKFLKTDRECQNAQYILVPNQVINH